MQYILHVTQQCNMACDYCIAPKTSGFMSHETAFKVADMALAYALHHGNKITCLSFYGGEPLLCKELIYDTIDYCNHLSHESNVLFTYRATTNGTLVDDRFIERCKTAGLRLALSIDGTMDAHDKHRRFYNGGTTFEEVARIGKVILRELPDTIAMLTLNEDTMPMFYDSVIFLRAFGFKTVAIALNYTTNWSESGLMALSSQYKRLADWYSELLLNNECFALPLFDNKFINLITPEIDEGRCIPGRRQISIATNGDIYPCTQYVGYNEYFLGNTNYDIEPNKSKLASLAIEHSKELPSCEGCAINKRCDHMCGCKNLASTGFARRVSPLVCAHEKMLVGIADRLGEKIFVTR